MRQVIERGSPHCESVPDSVRDRFSVTWCEFSAGKTVGENASVFKSLGEKEQQPSLIRKKIFSFI